MGERDRVDGINEIWSETGKVAFDSDCKCRSLPKFVIINRDALRECKKEKKKGEKSQTAT